MKKSVKFLTSYLLAIGLLSGFAACGEDSVTPVVPPAEPDKPETPVEPEPEPEPVKPEEQKLAMGADISWYTEMEQDSKKFYNEKGEERECPALMKEIGMNAIRLRVWVNPSSGYCHREDVVAKALAAHRQGLDLMIDFHYSDFFADPSRQDKPQDWKDLTAAELRNAVATHTAEILSALVQHGIRPKWIQIGNETRNGMLWPEGQLWSDKGDLPNGWKNYVALSNAGYNAAKSVCPDASVMVHLNNAYEDLDWWFAKFQSAGGKFDMIGLSHYPQQAVYDGNGIQSAVEANDRALSNLEKLGKKYGKKVMFCEVGVWAAEPQIGRNLLYDFINRGKATGYVAGFFYWEPQVYGGWKPAIYETLGWNAYPMGAFTDEGKPSLILEVFR